MAHHALRGRVINPSSCKQTVLSARFLSRNAPALNVPCTSLGGSIRDRRFVPKAAAVEEQATAEAPQPEVVATEDPAVSLDTDELELEELDEAQEQLLNWILHTDEKQQDEDLDEMVDYDALNDDEYEELFEEIDDMYEKYDYEFNAGEKVIGTVIDVDDDGAYVDIGAKAAGFVPLSECSFAKLKTPLEVLRIGMRREFMVVEDEEEYGQVILSLGAMEAGLYWQRTRQMHDEDITVYVKVESANKGGLLVTYGQYEGFIPVSQFGPRITPEKMDEFIGLEVPVKFLEVDEERERLVFSNKRASSNFFEGQGYQIGDLVLGTVQSLKPYGAFVDIGGGVAGLLHVSQISHERVVSVEKIFREGDKVKVMILSQDRERGRVTLTTKKLEPSPGDMLKDPQAVFNKADEMAASFRERLVAAQDSARQASPYGGTPDETGGFVF